MHRLFTDIRTDSGDNSGQTVLYRIALLAKGFAIPWQAMTRDEEAAKKKAASNTKYTCPDCGVNAWAKPDVRLLCGECETELAAED
jgi:ribosomal protein S27AE